MDMLKENEIVYKTGTDYKDMTKELLEYSALEKLIGSRSRKIGIKPNLVSPSPAEFGATTHPQIVEGIIEYLKEHGFLDLVILESSWVGDKTSDAYEYCGYRELCERTGVPFKDMQKEKGIKTDCQGMTLQICQFAKQIDFLINVPVMKGHCQTKVTCALKNMKGLIPNAEKRHFHQMGLHDPIAHLNTGIRQNFIVADNICGDLEFEDGGNPVVMNRILAGRDPVLMDAYLCSMLEIDPSEVPYIIKAEKLGVGSSNLKNAPIHSLDGKSTGAQETFHPGKVLEVRNNIRDVDSCSACYASLAPALVRLKEEGLLDRLKERICIGQGYRGKNGVLGVGNCTSKFDCCIKGCPPTEEQVYLQLKNFINM